MGLEPGGLVGGELGGGLAEVAQGLDGELAGDGVGVVFWEGVEGGGPAGDGGEDFGEGAADVDVAWAVVVQVVGELVGDGGELKDEVVGVLLAAGAAGMGVEVVEFLGAEVEEVDVKKDAVGGVVAGLADLFDLGLGEVGVGSAGRGEVRREREVSARVRVSARGMRRPQLRVSLARGWNDGQRQGPTLATMKPSRRWGTQCFASHPSQSTRWMGNPAGLMGNSRNERAHFTVW
jgi:hypothetical protein